MWQIITEPNKEYLVAYKPIWNDYDCAVAFCERMNKYFPNVFFGVQPVTDKYLSTAKEV